MGLFWNLFEYTVCVGEAIVAYVLFRQKLGTSGIRKILAVISIPVIALITRIMNNLSFPDFATIAINALVIAAYALLFFESSRTLKMLWIIMPPIIYLVSNYVVYLVMVIITPYGQESVVSSTAARAEALIIYTLSNMALLLALLTIKHRERFMPVYMRLLLLALVIVGAVATTLILNQTLILDNHGESTVVCGIASALILLMCVSIAALFRHMAGIYQQNLDMQKEKQQTELEEERLSQVESMYELVREWRHDTRNNLSTLATLAKSGDRESIIEYIEEMDHAAETATMIINTGNPAIDATVSGKLVKANRLGICINRVFAVPPDMTINSVDICAVVNNLFDNAVEAVLKVDEKHRIIDFSMTVSDEMLKISMFNYSNGIFDIKNGAFQTTKADKSNHGIGLRRVKNIVEKNGGQMLAEPCKDGFSVLVFIPLNN